MKPPWKLVTEDLGRIAHAEVEARPLLLFVGPNSTGKTYPASLMWGLLSLSRDLPVTRGEAHGRCVAWLEERFARRQAEPKFEVTREVHADLVQIINDTLRNQGAKLAERTFNRPGFKVGKVELREAGPYTAGPLCWSNPQGHDRQVFTDLLITPHIEVGWPGTHPTHHDWAYAIDLLANAWLVAHLSARSRPGGPHWGPVFLPASRTGFMLTYRSLAEQLAGDALIKTDGPSTPVPDFTTPAIDFVKLLIGLRPQTSAVTGPNESVIFGGGAYPDEAAFLERAMGGRLLLRSDIGLPEVLYEHTADEPALPMELSSSLVTELAPVLLTLRHVYGYRVIIIEEPEAHIHPHLQRVLAQVIVRLIRKGLFVWITTHSENFCQQINNFMKIGALPPDKRAAALAKLGYGEHDYLEVDDVGGYGFGVEGDRTIVKELKKAPDGLAMPTFNHVLFALAKEIDYLDDLAEEGT